MSEPNNIEGPPPTTEERAAMARELDQVAPTPADKFRLMFGQRPTPRTDEVEYYFMNHDSSAGESLKRVIDERDVTWDKSFEGYACPSEFARQLERELAEAREECEEQARLLGMSGEREAGLLAEVDRLKRELAEARALLAAANKGAERNAEALRISSQKLNEARAWSFRLRVDLAESRGQLDRLVVALRSLRDCIQETRGREAREAVEQADDILTELEGGAR